MGDIMWSMVRGQRRDHSGPDVDECESGSGGCSQVCKNTAGSFNCSCHAGYKLAADMKTCNLKCAVSDDPVVQTKFGKVKGMKQIKEKTQTPVNTFLNIPFAAPPVGELRWKPPRDPDAWSETLECTEQGNQCIQDRGLFRNGKLSEDCLNLNIFAPVCAEPGSKDVMVSIYGGGFLVGGNSLFDGHYLAGMFDVVVVVPNYRVGIFGFASTEDSASPGNYGLWDQVKALEWVRDNIAAFGGNPDSVTIMGESAGGASVGYMVISPLAEGLFHKAIYQSGTDTAPFARSMAPRAALDAVANLAGCSVTESAVVMECLRTIDADTLQNYTAVNNNGPLLIGPATGFTPTVDGTVVPDYSLKLRQEGKINKVPTIIGLNAQERAIHTMFLFPESSNQGASKEQFTYFLDSVLLSYSPFWPNNTDLEAVANALIYKYTNWKHPTDQEMIRYNLMKLWDDISFFRPADQVAKLTSSVADTYFYIYDYVSSGSFVPDWIGAYHGLELEYVFGSPYRYEEGLDSMIDNLGIFPSTRYTDDDRKFSYFMMELWTNFAKHGNPTPEETMSPVNSSMVTWPRFDIKNLTYFYLGDDVIESRSEYRQDYIDFWEHYVLKTLVEGDL